MKKSNEVSTDHIPLSGGKSVWKDPNKLSAAVQLPRRRYRISFYLYFEFNTTPNMVLMYVKNAIMNSSTGLLLEFLTVNEERQQVGGEWS